MRSNNLMYNEEQKQEYITFENSNAKALIGYFKRFGEKETEYSKDIADMDEEELKDTLASLNIRREESRRHMLSLVRGYINWARLYNKTNNESMITLISSESIDAKLAITSQMIKSPEHLRSILEDGIEKKDGEYLMPNRAVRDQLVFWLIYSGLSLDELCLLKISDLKQKTIITSSGNKYEIDDINILALWESCSYIMYIEKRNGRSSGKGKISSNEVINYELVDNDYLFKVIRGKKEHDDVTLKPGAFNAIISNICNMYSKVSGNKFSVSPLNIQISGIFHKLYMLEVNGTEVTPELVAKFKHIEYSDKADLLAKTRKWRKDYEDWKLAFGYM